MDRALKKPSRLPLARQEFVQVDVTPSRLGTLYGLRLPRSSGKKVAVSEDVTKITISSDANRRKLRALLEGYGSALDTLPEPAKARRPVARETSLQIAMKDVAHELSVAVEKIAPNLQDGEVTHEQSRGRPFVKQR